MIRRGRMVVLCAIILFGIILPQGEAQTETGWGEYQNTDMIVPEGTDGFTLIAEPVVKLPATEERPVMSPAFLSTAMYQPPIENAKEWLKANHPFDYVEEIASRGTFQGDIKRLSNYQADKGHQILAQDMLLSETQLRGFHQDGLDALIQSGKSLKSEFLWPGGVIPFVINEDAMSHRDSIVAAMDTITSMSCIRFKEASDSTKAYLRFQGSGKGCWSYLGYLGRPQPLNLGKECGAVGTIMHELGHALGLVNEQARADRDEYIQIDVRNVRDGQREEFALKAQNRNTKLSPYDYASVMHAGAYAFTKNKKATIIPKVQGAEIGIRTGWSAGDMQQINELYKCDEHNSAKHYARMWEAKYKSEKIELVMDETNCVDGVSWCAGTPDSFTRAHCIDNATYIAWADKRCKRTCAMAYSGKGKNPYCDQKTVAQLKKNKDEFESTLDGLGQLTGKRILLVARENAWKFEEKAIKGGQKAELAVKKSAEQKTKTTHQNGAERKGKAETAKEMNEKKSQVHAKTKEKAGKSSSQEMLGKAGNQETQWHGEEKAEAAMKMKMQSGLAVMKQRLEKARKRCIELEVKKTSKLAHMQDAERTLKTQKKAKKVVQNQDNELDALEERSLKAEEKAKEAITKSRKAKIDSEKALKSMYSTEKNAKTRLSAEEQASKAADKGAEQSSKAGKGGLAYRIAHEVYFKSRNKAAASPGTVAQNPLTAPVIPAPAPAALTPSMSELRSKTEEIHTKAASAQTHSETAHKTSSELATKVSVHNSPARKAQVSNQHSAQSVTVTGQHLHTVTHTFGPNCHRRCETTAQTQGVNGCHYVECNQCTICSSACFDHSRHSCPQWIETYGCNRLLIINGIKQPLYSFCPVSCNKCSN